MSAHSVKLILILLTIVFGSAAAVLRFMAALYDDVNKDAHTERQRDWFRRLSARIKSSSWVELTRSVLQKMINIPKYFPLVVQSSLLGQLKYEKYVSYKKFKGVNNGAPLVGFGDRFLDFFNKYCMNIVQIDMLILLPFVTFLIFGYNGVALYVGGTILAGVKYANDKSWHRTSWFSPILFFACAVFLLGGTHLTFRTLPLYALVTFPTFIVGGFYIYPLIKFVLGERYFSDADRATKVAFNLFGLGLITSYFLTGVLVTIGQSISGVINIKPTLQILLVNSLCDSLALNTTFGVVTLAIRSKRNVNIIYAIVVNFIASVILSLSSLYFSLIFTSKQLSIKECLHVFMGFDPSGGYRDFNDLFFLMHTSFLPVAIYTFAIGSLGLVKVLVEVADWFVVKAILNNKPLALFSALFAFATFTSGSAASLLGWFYR